MATRLARSAIGAARFRPCLPFRAVPTAVTPLVTARYESNVPSNVPQQDPKSRAQSIIDALPGTGLMSKTAILSTGAGLSIAAISNEIYVVNEESIILLSLLSIFWAVAHYGGPMFKEWAEGHNNKVRNILNAARKDHIDAVKARIDSVKDLSGVVEITKSLFEVSKETAHLEAQAFELEQKTALVAEAKTVLDSWVRYEGQVKQRQQRELAESIIAKVEKELEDPKVLKQILDQSIKDVERIVTQKAA